MMYCPQCRSEYEDFVAKCADCNVSLVQELSEEESEKFKDLEYKEIYTAFDELEYKNILDLLEKNEINVLRRTMKISSFPVNIGQDAGFRIAVTLKDEAASVELINEAIKDEYISSNGTFLHN